jgi:hypothetical protein
MPIKARVDMLSTGVRTPVGVKIFGADLSAIERTGEKLESVLRAVPGTRSVLYERLLGGTYVDVVPNREAMARYGLQVEDLDGIVEGAVGGAPVTVSVDGRQRYSVNVRYKEDFRATPAKLREVLVPLSRAVMGGGARSIPLGEVADVRRCVSARQSIALVAHLYRAALASSAVSKRMPTGTTSVTPASVTITTAPSLPRFWIAACSTPPAMMNHTPVPASQSRTFWAKALGAGAAGGAGARGGAGVGGRALTRPFVAASAPASTLRAGAFLAEAFFAGTFFATTFFATTFLAGEGFFLGFGDFFRDFSGVALLDAAFARVCPFAFFFFFLEPAMVAISASASLADPCVSS